MKKTAILIFMALCAMSVAAADTTAHDRCARRSSTASTSRSSMPSPRSAAAGRDIHA